MLAAKGAMSTIPIDFLTGTDPVAEDLVANLARSSSNITGFSLATDGPTPTINYVRRRLHRTHIRACGSQYYRERQYWERQATDPEILRRSKKWRSVAALVTNDHYRHLWAIPHRGPGRVLLPHLYGAR